MKLTCTKDNLKRALLLASKIVSSATTLPILNNVLLKTDAGQLRISSTNLEIALQVMIGAQIEGNGEITVPARTITDYVNTVSDDKVLMETKGTDLLIKTTRTESLLKGLPAEEFPLIPEIKPQATVHLEAHGLTEAVSQVAFAGAFSETQPELSGVLFNLEGPNLCLAATDRYRLAEKTLPLSHPVQPVKIIIPSRAVAELGRILAEARKTIEVLIADSQIMFRTPTIEFTSRLIEGQYPDYKQIIPSNFSTEVKVAREEFASALKLAGLFVADNSNVELQVSGAANALILRSTSQKFGSNTTQITAEIAGEDNQIVFNYRYILDCLNHTPQQRVVLKIINASSPAMIVPEGAADYRYLVMPIKT